MKFTKGDWKRNGFNHVGTEQKPVCFVYTELCSKEEAVANAKLIAAAPDMYQALINISKWLVDDTSLPTEETMDSVWNAIQKASTPDVWEEIKKTFK